MTNVFLPARVAGHPISESVGRTAGVRSALSSETETSDTERRFVICDKSIRNNNNNSYLPVRTVRRPRSRRPSVRTTGLIALAGLLTR